MKARGNLTAKWWTCSACQARWKIIEISTAHLESPPGDNELVTCGRHCGKTMLQVYQIKTYAQWVLMTMEAGDDMCSGLKRLADYLTRKEQAAATGTTLPLSGSVDDMSDSVSVPSASAPGDDAGQSDASIP